MYFKGEMRLIKEGRKIFIDVAIRTKYRLYHKLFAFVYI